MSLLHAPPKYTGKERNPQYLTAGTQSPRLLICCLFDGHKQAFLPQTLVGCLTMNTIAMNWCRETGPRQGVALEASDRELVSQARTLCKDPEVRRVRFLCSDAGEPVIKLSPAGEAAPVGSEAPN